MNERIKELSKEAGLVADATYAKAPDAIWLKEYNKKFAELIVRECADYLDNFNKAIIGDVGIAGFSLKKHFGVEE
jgi:hypothetical protein